MAEREPTRQRSILLVLHTLLIGGTERQVYLLATGLMKRGWRVEIFSFESRGDYGQTFEKDGIKLHVAGIRPGQSKISTLISLLTAECRLAWLLWSRRFGVVQAFLPLPNFAAAVAGRLARVPLIVTSKRNVGAHQDRIPYLRYMDIVSNRLSHKITANAKAIVVDAQLRENCDPEKLTVIPNGMDLSGGSCDASQRQIVRVELGLHPGEVAICYVASLAARKAHVDLIVAFTEVVARHPEARLILIGEDRGALRVLREQIGEAGMAEHVLLLGKRRDVSRLLHAMDIGVMASHEEGSSNALIEKLAAGLPVVATAVGGNPEELEGMPGCVLVQARDTACLAWGIMQAIEMDRKLGEAEIRRALIRERHSIKAMVDAYERLYAGRSRSLGA